MELWYSLSALLVTSLSLWLSGHVVLVKRDARAAALWVAIIWFFPVGGALLYMLLGVNRLRRQASSLRRPMRQQDRLPGVGARELRLAMGPEDVHLTEMAALVSRVTGLPLVSGNAVSTLVDGDAAFEAMLVAIEQSRVSVALSTYIFGNDRVGRAFLEALVRAQQRGVEVRILIDAAGERYSWPPMVSVLQNSGLRVARFLPGKHISWLVGLNLRNHRKLLVCDGRIGFTGGMNLRVHHCHSSGRRFTRDLHFRIEGPVVRQLQEIFAQDWDFAAGEHLYGDTWFPALTPAGTVIARAVPDGPDEDLDQLSWVFMGALGMARRRVCIMTPYFLPDRSLINALNLAALRGVEVDILLPAHNNLPFVHWAMMGQLWQVLGHGCRVWFSMGPFDHGKLMVVDEAWVFLGSANWDPRSLRLNFECNLECYDRELGQSLAALVAERIRMARPCTLADVDARALPVKLRDGIARLFSPFL
ncbi:MAG TPA: phospholipase D-like domain-containing protein [Candidatus Acidoferrales bacterium]|nr:phospholipase D-like domain-containing protein [Candidatus Acidoferrales bacterium]